MAQSNCDTCAFRKRYDDNPKSLLGRLWRWHAGWCPGWKAHMKSKTVEEQRVLAQRYSLKKYADRLGA